MIAPSPIEQIQHGVSLLGSSQSQALQGPNFLPSCNQIYVIPQANQMNLVVYPGINSNNQMPTMVLYSI